MRRVFALVLAFSLCLVFADVPHLISYQGRLTDGSGHPLTGTHTVTFRLYNAPTGGTALWTETHTVTLNSEGLFSVLLGRITAFPPSLDFSESYWLGISIDGGSEICRYRLGASPYALNIADTLIQPGGYLLSDGSYKAGLAVSGLSVESGEALFPTRDAAAVYAYSPSAPLGAEVGVYARSEAWEGVIGYSEGDDGVQGVTTSGGYAGVSGINTSLGVRGYLAYGGYGLYTDDNAHVGDYIDFKLLSLAPAASEGRLYYNGSDHTLYLYDGSSWVDLSAGGGGATPGGSDGQIQYNDGGTFGGASELYYDDADGKLGINTTNPSARLHIVDDVTSWNDGIKIQDVGYDGLQIDTTYDNGIEINDAGNDGVEINDAGAAGVRVVESGSYGFYAGSCGDVGFYADNPSNAGFEVFAGSATGCGLRIWGSANKPDTGVVIRNFSQYGIFVVGGSGACGVKVVTDTLVGTGLAITFDPSGSGVAADTGLVVDRARYMGIAVTTDSVYLADGVRVFFARDDGVQVDTAAWHGVYVRDTHYDGVHVYNSGDDGVDVVSPGGDCFVCDGTPHLFRVSGSCEVYSHSYNQYIVDDRGVGYAAPISVTTRMWLEHIGEGKLEGGVCRVDLPREFLESVTIDSQNPMQVFVTPYGDAGNFWVERGDSYFVLHAAADVEFAYRVLARVKGFEGAGMEPVDLRELRDKEARKPEER